MSVTPTVAERSLPDMSVLRGSLVVLATGVVFSFGGLAFRLTDDVTAWQYIIFRGLGALGTTVVILGFRYRRRVSELIAGIEFDHLLAGLLLGGMSGVFIVSLEYTSVAFVLFLQTLAPIPAAYFSWLFMRERVSAAVGVATAVSIVGILIMVSGTITDAVEPLGLLAILLPVMFGLYATLIRRASKIDPQVPILIGGGLLAVTGTLVASASDGFDISLHDALIGLIAGSALLAIPVIFLNLAARVVPAPETSLLLMSEVVLAPLWVWLFVDEEPEMTTLLGGAVILVAVFGLLLWRRRVARQLRAGVRPIGGTRVHY